MSRIATIHGGRAPNQPSEDIIAELERLLEIAKAGDLIGLAYVTVLQDGSQGTGWSGEAGSRHPMGTAIMMLNHRYAAALLSPKD